jgi:hypothetical protein
MGRKRRNAARSGTARGRGGLRAIRCTDRDADFRARLVNLRIDKPKRALRAERRAALSGIGYDPLRHLVLIRLARKRS